MAQKTELEERRSWPFCTFKWVRKTGRG